MSKAIEFNSVWKKYKRGEKFNSMRDAVPHFLRRLTKTARNNTELGDREFWAVKDAGFAVEKGEVVGLIGPNGAGKSTILKLLSGIIIPTKGSLSVQGRLSALIEVTAGFHSDLTGRENVYLNGTILGMKKKEIEARIEEIIEFSGVFEFIDTPVKRYSSGMMSRLGFSVAAHINPDILLVDEVLAVGDIAFQSKCAQKMRELLDSGVTIILVSHNLALVQSLCQRVILVDHGEIKKEGLSYEVIPHYENLVFKQMEEELKYQIHVGDQKVNTGERSPVHIHQVKYLDEQGRQKTGFPFGAKIRVAVEFAAAQRIKAPVFSLDIVRADGVVCCSSNTRDAGLKLDDIESRGSMNIDLGQINLAPGIYLSRIAVWDDMMVHPYAIRKQDVLRIEVDNRQKYSGAVFVPEIRWA